MKLQLNSNLIIWIIGLVVIVAVDQITKWLALRYLKFEDPVQIVPGILKLTLVCNYGSAFGLRLLSRGGYIVVGTLVILLLIKLCLQRWEPYTSWGYGLIIAGAIGNLIDRFIRGFVIDFISIMNFPVFNVADIAISLGMVLIIFKLILT